MEAALAPVKQLAAKAQETYVEEIQEFAKQQVVTKLKADAIEKAARKRLIENPHADVSDLLKIDQEEAPTLRRYIANDTSVASLGELHRQNHNGLLIYRDEMVSLLRTLDREDNSEARGFYLTGWNGDSSYTFDRITRGMNLHIPGVCISLLGSTQPGRISNFIKAAVSGGTGDDGLLQRFGLVVWPDTDSTWKDVDRWPDNDAKREAFKIFDYLDNIDPIGIHVAQDTGYDGGPDGIPYLRFDDEGLNLFREWRSDLETRLRSGDLHPALESHLAKYRKLVPGLALIIHLTNGYSGSIGRDAVLKALAWSEYLESHARRLYASLIIPEVSAAESIIKKIRSGALASPFVSWQVWRPGWAGLSDRQVVTEALQLLVDYSWLVINRKDTGGRPSDEYEVNPEVLK
jgi:putative DNA primase/helicase